MRALHKHRDRPSNALIDEHHEYLILVAKEKCATAAGRKHGTDLNFDNGLTHTLSSPTRLPPRPESLSASLATQRLFSRTGTAITLATSSGAVSYIGYCAPCSGNTPKPQCGSKHTNPSRSQFPGQTLSIPHIRPRPFCRSQFIWGCHSNWHRNPYLFAPFIKRSESPTPKEA